MQIGIIGLPNVGKSTLFNALANARAEVANYPFTTTDKNIGVVTVPDERLEKLGELLQPEKLTFATIEFVDIAGLVRGASEGEGLGNRFLAHIREVDCILHLVRGFQNPDVVHIEGSINPLRDIEVVNTELALSDLETLDRRIDKFTKGKNSEERELLLKAKETLSTGERSNENFEIGNAEFKMNFLLTTKPTLYVLNIDEDSHDNSKEFLQVNDFARIHQSQALAFPLKIESELAEMELNERKKMREEWGLSGKGFVELIRKSYELLDLVTFFTIKGRETKAWAIPRGTSVHHAAGKVHSEMEEGFIRAEVIHFQDFQRCGSMARVKEEGALKTEGKEYLVQDGDILLFKFKN